MSRCRLGALLILVILTVMIGLWTEKRMVLIDYYSWMSIKYTDDYFNNTQSPLSTTTKAATTAATIHMKRENNTFVQNHLVQGQQSSMIEEENGKSKSAIRHNYQSVKRKEPDNTTVLVTADAVPPRIITVNSLSATKRTVVAAAGQNTPIHGTQAGSVSTQDTPARFLLLRNPMVHGHANQQQCLHLASVLAVQYNRILLLPKNAGCRPNKHQNFSIPMERLYDVERAKRMLDYQEMTASDVTPPQCRNSPSIPFSHFPNFKLNASDPFAGNNGSASATSCIIFDCEWADTHMQAPKSIFPNVDEIYFRYHPRYWEIGEDIVQSMVGDRRSLSLLNNRLLGIQIRRGDRFTWPLLNCRNHDNDDDDGTTITNMTTKHRDDDDPLVNRWCRRSKEILKQRNDDELMWNDLFQLLPETTFENDTAATTTDAIFVATNDVNYVRALKKRHGWRKRRHRQLAPLYMMMTHFVPRIRPLLLPETRAALDAATATSLSSNAVEILVIEQIILAIAGRFIPSFPSTVPDHVFRMRLSLRGQQEQQQESLREQEHYDLYDAKFATHFTVMDQKEFFRKAGLRTAAARHRSATQQ